LGVPRRAFIRRKKAPQALGAWCQLRAARRRAPVPRCAPGRPRRARTLPPEIVGWGHRPSQRQPCCTRGPRCRAVPLALRMSTAVCAAMPSSVVRATLARRERGGRASHRGRECSCGGGLGEARAGPRFGRHRSPEGRCSAERTGRGAGESSPRERRLAARPTGARRARCPAAPWRCRPRRAGQAGGAAGPASRGRARPRCWP